LPRVACADPRAATVRDGAGTGAPVGLARLELAARASADDCMASDEEAEGACIVQAMAVVGASAGVVAAATAVWTACVVPSPVVVATCAGAVATFTSVSTALAVATNAYHECKEAAKAPKPCDCPAQGADALTGGTADPLAAHSALDCAAPPAEGGGGGGGQPAGGGGYWMEICEYVEHYDDDGNYLYTSDLRCRVEWVA
ncbi:hypothetical protein PYV61_22610, partial [Roseisolibacter sp. H3M3-2]